MMTSQSVDQVLRVLRLFRERYDNDEPLHKAYREGVREVARHHHVTYQTIGDGCRRRLKLDHIREFYDLLSLWVDGDPEPLRKRLKDACDPAAHDRIDEFFEPAKTKEQGSVGRISDAVVPNKSSTFSFQLSERDARMLRAVAEIEAVSPAELVRGIVGSAVAERMKQVAEAIGRDLDPPRHRSLYRQDIIDVLRRHEMELRRLGVERVSLFGSAARGDMSGESDIDLAVRLLPNFSSGGFDYFDRMEDLRRHLSKMLNCSVDVIEEPAESQPLQAKIDEDRVIAF
jgi:predicted nucleotidyltransferase